MSIRVALLALVVAGLSIYAWKDWFKSLCGLIVLMAFLEHPDMPKNIVGAQGLNPWNVLMFSILLAWVAQRRREGLKWDMPPIVMVLLLLYTAVIAVGFLRMIADRGGLNMPLTGLVSDHAINVVKWVIPGFLIFDGCRNRERLLWATASILGFYVLLAVQVVRHVPLSSAMSGAGVMAKRGLVEKNVGYHPVSMSMMLAGASWALLAAVPLLRRTWQRISIVATALMVVLAQALTGGRMGYGSWGVVGLTMGVARWRRYLLLAPVVAIVVVIALPGVSDRMLMGFGEVDAAGAASLDTHEISAGRLRIWPYIIEKIKESPALGHGRLAMQRTGLTAFLGAQFGKSEAFPHAHNAYLELLLENGILGTLPILAFYALVAAWSLRLFLARDNPLASAVGGLSLALVMGFLVAALGAQHFYPREPNTPMWAAIFLMFRVYVERERVLKPGHTFSPMRVRSRVPARLSGKRRREHAQSRDCLSSRGTVHPHG